MPASALRMRSTFAQPMHGAPPLIFHGSSSHVAGATARTRARGGAGRHALARSALRPLCSPASHVGRDADVRCAVTGVVRWYCCRLNFYHAARWCSSSHFNFTLQ